MRECCVGVELQKDYDFVAQGHSQRSDYASNDHLRRLSCTESLSNPIEARRLCLGTQCLNPPLIVDLFWQS